MIVLGTIHEGHLKHQHYSFSELRAIMDHIEPNVILAEIPPDRFPAVSAEFQKYKTISDLRMVDLPEYEAVIFPYAKDNGIEILPVSAWTREIAEQRIIKLDEFRDSPLHINEWTDYEQAHDVVNCLLEVKGNGYDPLWIDSTDYDEILAIEINAFNALFSDEINGGGLDDINKAHYNLITQALDTLKNSGSRILLTFGAGHKGWMRKQLAKRDDVELLTLDDVF